MGKIVLFLVFGLLPLWLSIAVLVASRVASQFWAAAPWLIVYGVFASGATLLSFLAANWTYRRYKGASLTKLLVAAMVYSVGPALLSAPLWMKYTVRSEEVKVRAFALQDKATASVMGGSYSVFIVSRTKDRSHLMPVRYQIALTGSRKMYAVVKVDRGIMGTPTFRIACTTSLSPGYWDSLRPLCDR